MVKQLQIRFSSPRSHQYVLFKNLPCTSWFSQWIYESCSSTRTKSFQKSRSSRPGGSRLCTRLVPRTGTEGATVGLHAMRPRGTGSGGIAAAQPKRRLRVRTLTLEGGLHWNDSQQPDRTCLDSRTLAVRTRSAVSVGERSPVSVQRLGGSLYLRCWPPCGVHDEQDAILTFFFY